MKTRLLGLGLALAAISTLGGCGVILDGSPGGIILESQPAVVVDTGYGSYGGSDGYDRRHGGYDNSYDPSYTNTTVVQAPAPQPANTSTIPIIQSFTANPSNTVSLGQPITFTVVASDPGRGPLQFNWSSTGGMLSTNTGRSVTWTPPDQPGIYTVSTIITNATGGAVTGSQNLVVQANGQVAAKPISQPVAVAVTPPAASPAPAVTPAPSAPPQPVVTPSPVAATPASTSTSTTTTTSTSSTVKAAS